MSETEEKLTRLLGLKVQMAEAHVLKAREKCAEIADQIAQINARRNLNPVEPADQIFHERHIGWLDMRARELSILAAQAAAEHHIAKDALRVEFGRKTALAKALTKRAALTAQQKSRQLS